MTFEEYLELQESNLYDILEDKIISKVTKNTTESKIWSDDSAKRRIRLVML